MHNQQQQVREFMVAMEQPTPAEPVTLTTERLKFRLCLIGEEASELHVASGLRWLSTGFYDDQQPADRLAQIDALVDILYVTYGMAVEMGVDLEPFWDEVHAANMRKVGGPVRVDGKRMKPEGWKPPDIAAVYRRIYNSPK